MLYLIVKTCLTAVATAAVIGLALILLSMIVYIVLRALHIIIQAVKTDNVVDEIIDKGESRKK